MHEDGSTTTHPGNKEIKLRRGDQIILTTDPAKAAAGTLSEVYIAYPHLTDQVTKGSLIYIVRTSSHGLQLSVSSSSSCVMVSLTHHNARFAHFYGHASHSRTTAMSSCVLRLSTLP